MQAYEKEKELWDAIGKKAEERAKQEKEALAAQEKKNQKLEHEREVRFQINQSADSAFDAEQNLKNARQDRNRFTIGELADLPIIRGASWGHWWSNVTDDMANQILTARNIRGMEGQAHALAAAGRFGEADELQSHADKLRAGLSALTEGERNPFRSLEEQTKKSAEALVEILRKSKEEGININPAMGK